MIDLGLSDETEGVNPFHFGPVGPDAFVARWNIIKEFAKQVAYGPNSYACIGGRRFGKSSILTVLDYVFLHEKSLAGRLLILRMDPLLHRYTTPSAVFAGLHTLLHHAALAVVERLRHQQPAVQPTPVSNIGYDSAYHAITASNQLHTGNVTAEAFGHALNRVIDALEEIGGPRRVVILIDEMDSFLDMPDHIELFGQLRASIYDGPAHRRLRLVLAGSSRFVQEETRRGSPLWNMLQKEYLIAFDEAGTDDLTARLPELDTTIRQAIWQASGGHPFIATYLLYHLKQHLLRHPDQPLTTAYVDTLVGRFLQTEIDHLNGWSKAIGLTGLQIYGLFVAEDGWLARPTIVQRVSDPKLDITAALNALCYHGFLLPDDAWGHFRRNGLLFRRWYHNEIARLIHELTPREAVQQLMPPFFRDLIVNGPLQAAFGERAVAAGAIKDSTVVTGNKNRVQQAIGDNIAQAGEDSSATVDDQSHDTKFDQREQKVDNQTNIAGDASTGSGILSAGGST